MKKFLAIIFIFLICSTLGAEKLFQYRGIFPATREPDAFITNYILLKKDTRVDFSIEEQKKGPSDRVKITELKLTSNPSVVFSGDESYKTLDVSETGIYQVRLEPARQAGGEIRFILKVKEIPVSSDLLTKKSEDNVAGESVARGLENASETAPVPEVEKDRVVDDISKFSIENVKIGKIETVEDIDQKPILPVATVSRPMLPAPVKASETASIMSDEPEQPKKTFIDKTSEHSPAVADTKIVIQSPEVGYYLNPFNGIRFTASGDTEDLLKFVRDSIMVLSNTKDGKEVQADGHFFLQSSEIVAFMPDKTEPGIVFTVKNRQDPDWITRFAAFPELNSRINFSSETVELIIFWKQLENYLPNPAGQVIRLNNSLIQIKTADETILTLDVEKAPPYGNFGAVSYRSRPYEMTFTIDRSGFDFENLLPLELSVQASVDGQKERVEVFNRRFHKESEELPDSPSATSEVKNIPPSSSVIQELSDLPEDVELLNIHRFTIVKSDSQRFRAWPEEVAWSEDGTMWVVDSQRRKLMNFDAEGNLKFAFGEKGKKPGSMSLPVALVVQKGRIFVSDRTAVAIHKFSEDGTFLKTITTSQKSSFVLGQPGTLCIRGTELWVADRTKNRIHCFDIEGKHLGGFGIEVDAHINSPVGVRADSEGLWVLESNGIIKKFTPMGQQTGAFQTGCSEPRGFDVDPWGGIWVCDAAKNQVIRFNASGRLLNLISAPPGPKPWVPTGVAVRKDGMIAVTDAENKQIHIFAAEK